MPEDGPTLVEVRRVFELYVDELKASSSEIDELLVVRLRYFGEDVESAAKRLGENPALVVELMHHLSSEMQELDTVAGESAYARKAISRARSLALLLPETGVHDDPPKTREEQRHGES